MYDIHNTIKVSYIIFWWPNCMCMYVCVCMYVYVCVCMYVYVCIIHLCVGRCYVVCPYDSDKWDFIALERMRPINVHVVYHSAIIIMENTKVLQFLQRQQQKKFTFKLLVVIRFDYRYFLSKLAMRKALRKAL